MISGHLTYLVLELIWALPVLLVQWVVGARKLWTSRLVLLAGITIPSLYLAAADGFAIANGIWVLHSDRILGFRLGDLPVEEMLFFLLTNAMVAQAVILIAGRRESP